MFIINEFIMIKFFSSFLDNFLVLVISVISTISSLRKVELSTKFLI